MSAASRSPTRRNLRRTRRRHAAVTGGACSRRRRGCASGRCSSRGSRTRGRLVLLPPQRERRDRARPLGEHLLRHVLAHRRDAADAVAQAAAAFGWSSSPTTPTRRCRPARPRPTSRRWSRYFTLPRQRIPALAFPPNPWASTFTGGTTDLAGMAARDRDRRRAAAAADDNARQRPRRRSQRSPCAHAGARRATSKTGCRYGSSASTHRPMTSRTSAGARAAMRRSWRRRRSRRLPPQEHDAVPVGAGRARARPPPRSRCARAGRRGSVGGGHEQ